MKVRTDLRAGNVINDASASLQNTVQNISGYAGDQKDRFVSWSQKEVNRVRRFWDALMNA